MKGGNYRQFFGDTFPASNSRMRASEFGEPWRSGALLINAVKPRNTSRMAGKIIAKNFGYTFPASNSQMRASEFGEPWEVTPGRDEQRQTQVVVARRLGCVVCEGSSSVVFE